MNVLVLCGVQTQVLCKILMNVIIQMVNIRFNIIMQCK
jgi:hypothetical protein